VVRRQGGDSTEAMATVPAVPVADRFRRGLSTAFRLRAAFRFRARSPPTRRSASLAERRARRFALAQPLQLGRSASGRVGT
jgi:hypothetical protein